MCVGSASVAFVNNSTQLVDGDYIFIDRSGRVFEFVLELLRTGSVHLPADVSTRQLEQELDFYQIPNPKRSCMYDKRLPEHLVASDAKWSAAAAEAAAAVWPGLSAEISARALVGHSSITISVRPHDKAAAEYLDHDHTILLPRNYHSSALFRRHIKQQLQVGLSAAHNHTSLLPLLGPACATGDVVLEATAIGHLLVGHFSCWPWGRVGSKRHR